VNEGRVAVYVRLMQAQQQIAEALSAHGVEDGAFANALEAADSAAEDEYDIYLGELGRYVAALGGHLELRAVFPEETVTVLRTDTAHEEAGG
jgi:hypothetical protein